MNQERLDKILVTRGLVSSRERGKQLILDGHVLVDGEVVNKAGRIVPLESQIVLLEKELPWVSRGALKLLAALSVFQVTAAEKTCLDIGASTGGFTEVMLNGGAKQVFCVDVGTDQLVEKIKQNPKVINLEKTHVYQLSKELITEDIDLCVIDVSFISLTKIFEFIVPFLKKNAQVIALLKPQFEVGPSNLNKKGVVKNPDLFKLVKKNVVEKASLCHLSFVEEMVSPILGGDGNKEFLLLFEN